MALTKGQQFTESHVAVYFSRDKRQRNTSQQQYLIGFIGRKLQVTGAMVFLTTLLLLLIFTATYMCSCSQFLAKYSRARLKVLKPQLLPTREETKACSTP